MAAPVDAGRATTNSTVSGTSHSLNLPGSIAAGDILIAVVRCPASTTISWPAGWTEWEQSNADASDDETSIAYRVADGSEGATITITLGTSRILVGYVVRVTGGGGASSIAFSAAAVGSATQPDSPASGTLAATGKDFLALSIGGTDGTHTLTSGPTGYSNATVQGSTATGTSGSTVFGATKQVTAGTSENPGAWTLNTTSIWVAWTVLISDSPWRLRVSQEAAEAIVLPSTMKARVTSEAAEALVLPTTMKGRVTSGVVEALVLPTNMKGRVTAIAVEVLVQNISPDARVSQAAAEVLMRRLHEDIEFFLTD